MLTLIAQVRISRSKMLNVEETQSPEEIRAVMCDPEIYERISSDDCVSADEWVPASEGEYWVAGYIDGVLAAMFNIHPINPVNWEGHMQVLKPFRHHAHELFNLAIAWAWDNTPAQKITVQIPAIYPEVAQFLKHHGFIVEGVNARSIQKYGVLLDQIYMGLERGDHGKG